MLLDIQESTGMMPKALQARPLQRADCSEYRAVFDLISGRREYNQAGVQPLPLGAVESYINIMEIRDVLEREKIMKFMCSMDDVFMEYVRKKTEQALSKK